MTRSDRARWTDLQVLAFLYAADEESAPSYSEPLTVRAVEAALDVSHGRATRAIDRLMRGGLVGRDECGLYARPGGWDALLGAGFDIAASAPVIAYPRDTEAA